MGELITILMIDSLNVVSRKYKVNSLLYLVSSGTYLSGFLLWNVDNIFCHQLRYVATGFFILKSGSDFCCVIFIVYLGGKIQAY